jgi:hypothetical protein
MKSWVDTALHEDASAKGSKDAGAKGSLEGRRASPDGGPKERKAVRKTREFKEYLVESGTVEAVVKLLVGMMETPSLERIDTENLLQDFFGHYRDPMWDVVEGLWASNTAEKEKHVTLDAQMIEIENEIEIEKRRLASIEVWRALAPDPSGESKSLSILTGKDFLMKMCGLKKPQDGLVPPVQVVREKFVELVDGYEDGPMRDWMLALGESLRAGADPVCGGDRMQEPELLRLFQEVQDCG